MWTQQCPLSSGLDAVDSQQVTGKASAHYTYPVFLNFWGNAFLGVRVCVCVCVCDFLVFFDRYDADLRLGNREAQILILVCHQVSVWPWKSHLTSWPQFPCLHNKTRRPNLDASLGCHVH